ncbi:MAG: hypothetical protein V3U64_03630 [Cocleimonas sp.]
MNEGKTSIEKLATMNLEGLLLPEPTPVSLWWLWVIIGLVLLAMVLVGVKKYHSPKATALRSLKQLQRDVSGDGQDSQRIKKQIAVSLRQGFEVARLDNVMPDNMQWREYLNTLETAVYSNKSSDQKTLSTLILNAQTWLRTR